MKEWQFNVLFWTAVVGTVFLMFAPDLGLKVADNPVAYTGIGTILAYVLTQKRVWTIPKKTEEKEKPKEGEEDAKR